jgi:hypothetical protein
LMSVEQLLPAWPKQPTSQVAGKILSGILPLAR